MEFGLHSQIYLLVIGSNLHRPSFEQFIKHEFISKLDCRTLNRDCISDCVKLLKFAKFEIDKMVKTLDCEIVEELIVALRLIKKIIFLFVSI
jgi:hypothetical protein